MAELEEPAAKRRKVQTGPEARDLDAFLTEFYLGLASVEVVGELLSGASDNFLPDGPKLYAQITQVAEISDGLEVQTLPQGQGKRDVLKFRLRNCSDTEIQAFNDCKQLDNPWKYIDHKYPPIACAYVTIQWSHAHDGSSPTFWLRTNLCWRNCLQPWDSIDADKREILSRYVPAEERSPSSNYERWDPREFYENVYVPEKTPENSAGLRVGLLNSQLFPFQRRAVRWLLSREGMSIEPSGQVIQLETPLKDKNCPSLFAARTAADGRQCYISPPIGVATTTDLRSLQRYYGAVKGGILAEEMGLGKTVELIALICLHTRPSDQILKTRLSPDHPVVSGATLIITPPTILEQWKQEVREHAPSLKIYHYEGHKQTLKQKIDLAELADYDIVVTTYNVIAKEVYYVMERPDRYMRHKPRFEPPKSMLTQIEWWRVCLDEAQMVESGTSAAAMVARLIPRVNAWAVSGTPLRKAHRDLYGLVLFLGQEPWCRSGKLWDMLIDFYRPNFRSLMNSIAIRHSKDFVREELRLPPQARHTITVPFTAIEEQHYAQLFREMHDECGVDQDGAPLSADWDPNLPVTVHKMRNWLTRLRQTCLHPEVGSRNRRALGRSAGPLRTVLQVLDVMIDQNETAMRAEQRVPLLSQLRRGQMMENAKNPEAALEIWKAVYKSSCTIVDECRAQFDTESSLQDQSKAQQEDQESIEENESDAKLSAYRQRLRSALEMKHMSVFFIANAYFQLKSDAEKISPESEEFKKLQDEEETAFEQAKSIRGELLSDVLRKVNRLIVTVRSKAEANELTSLPTMEITSDYSGIESRRVYEKVDRFCEAMNVQAKTFNEMRQKMVTFLCQSLIDEDEGAELKGDEYESSTKQQDEMYAYMEALRAMFADRGDAISGLENTLIRHEVKGFLQAAKNGQGPAPEVMIKLMAERENCRIPSDLGSLRGIISEIRQLISSLQWRENTSRTRAELAIATEVLRYAQEGVNAQTKSITALEQEVNQFRETMNSRLDYYRALQKISDTVAPFEEEKVGLPVDMIQYNRMLKDEEAKNAKVSGLLSKRRYLLHLKAESSSTTSQRICTICQSDFEVGTLTVCGHQFCKECIRLWYSERKNCPVCKRGLKTADFWDVTYKPAELTIQEEAPPNRSPESEYSERSSINRSIYSDISSTTLNEIKNVDLAGASFGSKVDTICRHLLWLREHDAGSKVVIFSQFREFIEVLGRALHQSKIVYSGFDEKNGIERFKKDPVIECFLLHAKAHSAGLNLVVANHVFLCEPLINTAIELQAIARVHRIGQLRPTTVWMYLVAGTVEEKIYDVSVTRRLAHMKGKSKANSASVSGVATPNANLENAIDVANSLALQAADLSKLLSSGRSGGEMVEKKDLWQCLFGRVTKGSWPPAAVNSNADVTAAAAAANSEIGRFLRAEATEQRQTLVTRMFREPYLDWDDDRAHE